MRSFYRHTDAPLKCGKSLSGAKLLAYCAVECALLIVAQLAFSALAGVEVVTVLFISFCLVFGVKCGVLTATAFSLLRCFIWGFYPAVIILYLLYYPAVAVIFGLIGKLPRGVYKKRGAAFCAAVNVVALAVTAACALELALDFIKVAAPYKSTVIAAAAAALAVALAGALTFDGLLIRAKLTKNSADGITEGAFLTAVACVCTAAFTLLDDLISPLLLGMGEKATLAYFYASFTVMLPQLICTAVSVSVALPPLRALFSRLSK